MPKYFVGTISEVVYKKYITVRRPDHCLISCVLSFKLRFLIFLLSIGVLKNRKNLVLEEGKLVIFKCKNSLVDYENETGVVVEIRQD